MLYPIVKRGTTSTQVRGHLL